MLVEQYTSVIGTSHVTSPLLRGCHCGGICGRCTPVIKARLSAKQLLVLDLVRQGKRRLALLINAGEEEYHDRRIRYAREAGYDEEGIFLGPF